MVSGTRTVFVVQHVHEISPNSEDVKFIGVYSTRDNALSAVARLRVQAGFAETPDGFHIDEYVLDVDHWGEGFVTV